MKRALALRDKNNQNPSSQPKRIDKSIISNLWAKSKEVFL